MPNLDEMIAIRGNISNAGDYRSNILEELIPMEDIEYEQNKLKNLVFNFLKKGIVTIIVLNLAYLLIDPKPIYKSLEALIPNSNSKCVNYWKESYTNELKMIESKLRHLEYQIAAMNMEFSNLSNWRINHEHDVLNEFIKTKDDTLEYISNLEQKMVNTLSLYDADKLGIIDYALESAGGVVISTPNTIPYPSTVTYVLMGMIQFYTTSSPNLIIQPGTLPGQCFAFYGPTGSIRIKLARNVLITSVTLEHTHRNLISDNTSCPRDFKVYGLKFDEDEVIEKSDLGTFTYVLNDDSLQNFEVENDSIESFELIELNVLNNYGNNEYTCIYRFRVHGRPI
ncbi:SUN domain-containing protein 2-like isoform X2 [Onthophagus taurus]|nr:SUN domain-containing protein 2-like isoform X2 [Onthophagus taurus]